MTKISFPADYAERSCYLVPINASLIPLVAGALRWFEKRATWETPADYEAGYNAFSELQVCMMRLCVDDLIESNNRLYRLLDTAIYGTAYSVVETEPELIVAPEIEPTKNLVILDPDSMLGRMEDMRQLLQNALNGTETPAYDRANGVRDLLEQLITAIQESDNLDAEQLEQLVQIVGLLA
jgi:hypothetical protein